MSEQPSGQILVSTAFSISHLWAAYYFAMQAKEIEDKGSRSNDALLNHSALASGSVISTAAFLEAAINEFFSDAAYQTLRGLPDDKLGLLKLMWEQDVPRTASYKIVQKYQIALALVGQPPIDPGKLPCQAVVKVINVRNALIHYESELVPITEGERPKKLVTDKFEKDLSSAGFAINPLAGESSPYFPGKLLGYGFCKYAITNAIAFADEFFGRVGIEGAYNAAKKKITL